MKILLFGKNGQVGWELQRSLAPLGELIALNRDSSELCGDLTRLEKIAQTIQRVAPDVIVNAAAYTAVDKAENEPDLAHIINALAPGVLAKEAKRNNAWLVHYSTDYVFDGSGSSPRIETDLCAPLNVYGRTKREGEQLIAASGCHHLIFRTSWIYSTYGNNFIKTMLRLGKARDSLSIVDDQIGAPTSADLIADITAHTVRTALQRPTVSGLYHLVASEYTSWYHFARLIFDCAQQASLPLKLQPDALLPIASSDFPLPAERPLNSRLDTHKLESTFNLKLPHWKTGVTRVFNELDKNKY
ncbi:MAG: dTDP-4-dehydrorhamnose reductase [Nitrosomonas sp.]|nr:dTDP-4-dehydrorhamnose reductase [Nitrosomonas sp.]MDP1950050.1 dTDP-4-dehydrorhamnose reductase [Nitrosomonas sp.]